MRLTEYETRARREIEAWQRERPPLPYQLFTWAVAPLDWLVDGVLPAEAVDRASQAISGALELLSDASSFARAQGDVVGKAKAMGLDVETVEDLAALPLEELDPLARTWIGGNALLAALEGGGTGLGGPAFVLADIPLLFTINFRLIQQVGASYGLPIADDDLYPLVLAIFNVAASDSAQAKSDALREASVAGAALAGGGAYRGRSLSGTLREQNRQLPREIAKQILSHKLGQMIPVAGAAVAAGVNYWFTNQASRAAYMVFRAVSIERKERL